MSTGLIPERTTLVMAHPDDEVLWASSVLSRLERVVLCFEEVPSQPGWSRGRRRSMAEYPLPFLTQLRLMESEVFDCADWPEPVETATGLLVKRPRQAMPGYSASRYLENHRTLLDALRPLLNGSACVLTHSPWGEYGHEEHVQVFRAVADLQLELGFDLWIPGYVSEKSYGLMLRHLPRLHMNPVSYPTDPALVREIRMLYSRSGCWTWYEDYVWPEQEHFYRWGRDGEQSAGLSPGNLVPMHLLWTNWLPPRRPPSVSHRLLRRARRLLHR